MKLSLTVLIITLSATFAFGQRNATQEVERGHELKKAGNDTAAIEAYSRAIELEPGSAIAYIERGELLAKSQKWAEALPDFTKAVEIDPQNYAALVGRAYSLAGLRYFDECIVVATKAIGLDPANPAAYIRRGYCYYSSSRAREAFRDFNQAIELGMTTADAYARRASARDAMDDWLGAIIDHTRAIELAPNDWKKYRGRAIARRSYGDYLGSVEDYNKVLELAPGERYTILDRSWAKLFNSDSAGAYQDTIDYLGEEGVASAAAPFPVIVGYIALRRMGKPEAANALVQGALKVKRSEWDAHRLRFLAGEITPVKLLELAKNDELLLTDAHALIGTKYLLDGDRRNAIVHFKWDQEHGSHERILHQLARTEYARMTGDPRLLTPPLPPRKP